MDSPQGGASMPSPKANTSQLRPERVIVFGSIDEEMINKEIL